MAESITINLSDSEASQFLEVGQALYPDASGAELREWAGVVAKNGLRAAVGELQLVAIRQQENANRQTERDEFVVAWPEEPNPLAPDPEGDPDS